jgi:hypothetical protein
VAVSFIGGGISIIFWQSVLLVEEFQLYLGSQFYWWRKPENTEKTTDLPQNTDT